MAPAVVSPHTWPPPPLRALNRNPPDTLTGTLESIVDPFPREMPWPQQYAVPVAVAAQATLPAPVRIASGITMSNGALLADESPGAVATRLYSRPGAVIAKPVKVATPLIALTLVVPVSAPAPAFPRMVSEILSAALTSATPPAAFTWTLTGDMVVWAVVPVGCRMKANAFCPGASALRQPIASATSAHVAAGGRMVLVLLRFRPRVPKLDSENESRGRNGLVQGYPPPRGRHWRAFPID